MVSNAEGKASEKTTYPLNLFIHRLWYLAQSNSGRAIHGRENWIAVIKGQVGSERTKYILSSFSEI